MKQYFIFPYCCNICCVSNFNWRSSLYIYIYIYIYIYLYIYIYVLLWRCDPTRIMASLFLRFLDHTQRRNTFGRTPLDEWSALRKDLYLTTHNTHNRQTSMPPMGLEPTILAGERLQAYALYRTATGTGIYISQKFTQKIYFQNLPLILILFSHTI